MTHMPRAGGGLEGKRQISHGVARTARGLTRRSGKLSIAGRSLQLEYDRASGRWSLTGTGPTHVWRCEATSRIELMTPVGQIDERDVASAGLVSCREVPSKENEARRFEVWRSWPDGLAVGQRFRMWTSDDELSVELVVRAPGQYRSALRALQPLARPTPRGAN